MYLKIHERKDGKIVAVCDKGLIGKVLEENDLAMDLDKYRDFYVGDLSNEEEIKKALSKFNSANLVGEKAVNVALHMNLAEKSDIMYIKSVPYIQLYSINQGGSV